MFTRVQVRNYRCLKEVDLRMGGFHALVGANASGKTTFLDVLGFLSDLMRFRGNVVEATKARGSNFSDLLWKRRGRVFRIAVEAEVPARLGQHSTPEPQRARGVRYEIEVKIDPITRLPFLDYEVFRILDDPSNWRELSNRESYERFRKYHMQDAPKLDLGQRVVIAKITDDEDIFLSESKPEDAMAFRLGLKRSALANVPADEARFPLSLWFRDLLAEGVRKLSLDGQRLRRPSPYASGAKIHDDGSNLPWVIAELKKKPKRFQLWLDHIRTALEDVESIDTVERKEDKHRYLTIKYTNGVKVPSWLVSDGTLRLLALTVPAYLDDTTGIFLVEEPENGIHPRAIETVIQSLSSMYDGQVLIATHSPIVINCLEQDQLLCFAKNSRGSTDIVSGKDHPRLRDWKKGQPELGILMASGILG